MWRGEATNALLNDDLIEVLEEEKPNDLIYRKWRSMNMKACGNSRGYLCPSIKYIYQREANALVLGEKFAKQTM